MNSVFLTVMTSHVVLVGADAPNLAVSVFGCVGKDVIVISTNLIWNTSMFMIKTGTEGYSGRQDWRSLLTDEGDGKGEIKA